MGKIVGILSMQKVINYGSYLQAYALKQLLLKNGADKVYFIDIIQGTPLTGYEYPEWNIKVFIKNFIRSLLTNKLFSHLKNNNYLKKLRQSIENNFGDLGLYETPPNRYDLVVIGSDEVFNCCQMSTWGYTLQLYGEISDAEEVITYAGSFGHTTMEQLCSYKIDDEISVTMKGLKEISVRDDNSEEIVKKLTGRTPLRHIDPVLAYGYKEEIENQKIDYAEDYLLIYSYHDRITNSDEIKVICDFADKNKLKIISVFCRYDWCDKAIIPDTPVEVLGWFKNAKYVITDTFHGTIFSIITHSNFSTIIRDTNRQKITSLLEHFKLENRQSNNDNCFEQLYKENIDYSEVEKMLERDRLSTMTYLCKHLKTI